MPHAPAYRWRLIFFAIVSNFEQSGRDSFVNLLTLGLREEPSGP
jgi:hypothetical protein